MSFDGGDQTTNSRFSCESQLDVN